MQLISKIPITPGIRHQINLTKNLLAKNKNIFKNLNYKIKIHAGRSTQTGHITIRHRGNGCKKKFLKRKFLNFKVMALILMVMYDPYRSSFISLCFDIVLKFFFFSPATQTTFPGSIIVCNKKKFDLYFGNRSFLNNFPVGVLVHHVCMKNSEPSVCRSAGTFCQIIQKKNNDVKIRVPSGIFISLKTNLFATFGRVSNLKYNLTIIGKAGRNKLKGIRPNVRGVAMNPVDHPHGGRTKGGFHPMSPWGILTKGKKTKKNE